MAVHDLANVGLAKVLAGALFATGLMMVVITGAELFTGNCLLIVAYSEKKYSFVQMLKNWFFVYTGNFIGSMIVVFLIMGSGQLGLSEGQLGGFTIKVAANKTGLTFLNAFTLGILCNWLVCVAIWMAFSTRDITGKLLAIFFPIWLFITSGFEHSVANMYYIPAGIFASQNPDWVDKALQMGVSLEKLDALNWSGFLTRNLLPVTLGNLVGGVLFVGLVYWMSFLYKPRGGRD